MSKDLGFERPINDLEDKIKDLKDFSHKNKIDLSHEIYVLNKRLREMKSKLYKNLSPWERTCIARYKDRPRALDYIEKIFDDFIELHGDRYYGDDQAIIGGIGRLGKLPITIIGHQKGRGTRDNIKRNFGMPNPEGYRKALRLMKQAEKFNRPIVTFIDTPGAYCGLGAEERGQGEAIARNLMEMSKLKSPIISIVIGEGGSGGALGLGVGDRLAMLKNSIYSVISPEGLASILWKDASQAERGAEIMKLVPEDLLELDIIDKIIEEGLDGAHKNLDLTSNNIKSYIEEGLVELLSIDREDLISRRYEKFRDIGLWAQEKEIQ